MNGISGTLLTRFFAQEVLFTQFQGRLGEDRIAAAHSAFRGWWTGFTKSTGPASSLRTVWDRGVAPVVQLLGYDLDEPSHDSQAMLHACGRTLHASIDVFAVSWGQDLARVWQAAACRDDVENRWCLCFNGVGLRLVDAWRAYSDRHLAFDLEALATTRDSFAICWAVLRAAALRRASGGPSLFEQLIDASAVHAVRVNSSLRQGVLEFLSELLTSLAITSRRPSRPPSPEQLTAALEGSLTVVYRVLFLLFAEARGLVPVWHPVYRHSYTIASLRAVVEGASPPRGLWDALRAISRLAREGCVAGDLTVTPFNGRLFAPASVDSGPGPDERSLQRALLAISTTPAGPRGRQRIDYRDLGVEQLGAVYEGVLDYRPVWSNGRTPTVRMCRGGRERKTTGTFYTPRSITEYLVRQTLRPLTRGVSSTGILTLRVLDPAMGSGAFLVAACRYLARAYEAALTREGACTPGELTESDRCTFRRLIAQRCLFGVDLSRMAVQLSRLSLWLATLAADRPLTFLDHHLKSGDSLLGVTPDDLARRPPPSSTRSRSKAGPASFPLFDDDAFEATVKSAVADRVRLAIEPGDTLPAVREKERLLARLAAPAGALQRWRQAADLWCACWFWPDEPAPSRTLFTALSDRIMRGHSALAEDRVDALLQPAREIAGRRRFFHWALEFPEAFFEADGRPRPDPGFDAVVGNPPWEMLRADSGNRETKDALGRRTRFIKEAGVYRHQSRGHINLYQTFLERAVQLTRQGGRLGLALPSGLLTDAAAAPLRRLILERCDTESLVLLDNRDRVFPIHRSVRIALITTTRGRRTRELSCRAGVRNPEALDAVEGSAPDFFRVHLTPGFLARVSGAALAIPELRWGWQAALIERITATFGPLGSVDGWNLAFGRELNATEDARWFAASGPGLVVLEGKHVTPFRAHLERCRRWIPGAALHRAAPGSRPRARLAYREVASATNRLTLIAAIVPARAVTTHTLFCLKTPTPVVEQAFLCGMLNSFVANFLVRLFVTTHVTAAVIRRLCVPRPDRTDPLFRRIAALSGRLASRQRGWTDDYARLQALAARAYGLDTRELEQVLSTFPLVEPGVKTAVLEWFRRERRPAGAEA